MTTHSFLPYILQHSRVTDHSATLIDNIFSNVTDIESVSGNLTPLISDHFIQFMFMKRFHISYKSSIYYVHDYPNFGEEKFIHDFSEVDWFPLDDMSQTVDNNFDYFYSKITSFIESHLPKKRVTRRNLKLRTKPWIGSKIQKLMYLRDKFFHEANSNPTPSNKYLYQKFRNRVVAEQRQK